MNCNYWLHKIRIIDTPKCRFCEDVETIEHYFYECKLTYEFWSAFLTWWNTLDIPPLKELHSQDVLFGFSNMYNEGKILNCCILLAKWCVYSSKSKNVQPNIYQFHCELKHFLKVEEAIALENKNHENFWFPWFNILFTGCYIISIASP